MRASTRKRASRVQNEKTSKLLEAIMRNTAALLACACALLLFCGTVAFAFPSTSGSSPSTTPDVVLATQGTSPKAAGVQKSEMVYGMLDANGSLHDTYVVNRFIADTPGTAEDFGAYAQVANLSTTQTLKCTDGKVSLDIAEDPFFYQGTLEDAELPWIIALTYTLDGRTIAPADLAGASGLLEISVDTRANQQVNRVFYKSFMLQVTFTLDGGLSTDIKAEGATLAASGKDQTIAFTVLPGHDGSFKLAAKVKDFTMPSVQIAALPYSSVIEMPDTSEMEGGLDDLSSAISQLDAGTSDLAYGVASLSSGAESLASGAGEFGDGLSQLAASSAQIVSASSQINDVLAQIAAALATVDLSNIDDLAKYSPVLRGIAEALDSLKTVVQGLDDGYERMAQVMDYLASIVYNNPLTDDEIAALRAAVADDAQAAAALEKLLATYFAAQQAVDDYYASGGSPETIAAQLEAIFADGGEIDRAINALYSAADFLDNGGIDQLKQLVSGLEDLSSGYDQFHAGLVSYTQGVQALDANYASLASGMSQLADGTSQLSSGASQLSSGVAQLNSATSDLPAQMRERMGELMADYDFPEFDPISFVDERNENVTAVQFVFLTDAIEKPAPSSVEPEPKPEPTMWDRFLALLGM